MRKLTIVSAVATVVLGVVPVVWAVSAMAAPASHSSSAAPPAGRGYLAGVDSSSPSPNVGISPATIATPVAPSPAAVQPAGGGAQQPAAGKAAGASTPGARGAAATDDPAPTTPAATPPQRPNMAIMSGDKYGHTWPTLFCSNPDGPPCYTSGGTEYDFHDPNGSPATYAYGTPGYWAPAS